MIKIILKKLIKNLKKLENKEYSFNKIAKVVEEIDKISLSREYEFINAEVIESKIDQDKLDIILELKKVKNLMLKELMFLEIVLLMKML